MPNWPTDSGAFPQSLPCMDHLKGVRLPGSAEAGVLDPEMVRPPILDALFDLFSIQLLVQRELHQGGQLVI